MENIDDSETLLIHPATYILALENGKYYVGNTTNLTQRLSQHFHGFGGSCWTSRHKPISVHQVIYPSCAHNELLYFLAYAEHYGINSVRGSYWTKEKVFIDPVYSNKYREEVEKASKLEIY